MRIIWIPLALILVCVASPANAFLIGAPVLVEFESGLPIPDPLLSEIVIVSSTVELPEFGALVPGDENSIFIDLNSNTLLWRHNHSTGFVFAAGDEFRFSDIDGVIPPFSKVALQGGGSGFDLSRVLVSSETITFDMSGLVLPAGFHIVVTTLVPEPDHRSLLFLSTFSIALARRITKTFQSGS